MKCPIKMNLIFAAFSAILLLACSDSPTSSDSPASSADEKIESSSGSTPLPGGNSAKSIYDAKKQTLTDGRDGHVYKTFSFDNRVWMAENLNYNYNIYSAKSTCLHNDTANCLKNGRSYTWSAAMDSMGIFSIGGKGCGVSRCRNITGTIRGVCPEGWHLPNFEEWNELSYAMKAEGLDVDFYAWNRSTEIADLENANLGSVFWTSRNYEGNVIALYENGDISFFRTLYLEGSYPVRCVMNYDEKDVSPKSDRKIVFGTLKDSRDGRVYKTVDIGDQTWMAENLKYEYPQVPSEKTSCFRDDPANCDSLGRLYEWRAAVDSAMVFSEDAKECRSNNTCILKHVVSGICPEGWRIPRVADFLKLAETVGGSDVAGQVLKGRVGWNYEGRGYDLYGFNALPYDSLGKTSFWTSDVSHSEISYHAIAYGLSALSPRSGFFEEYIFDKLPIRCLKYSKADFDSTSLYIRDESLYDPEAHTLTDLRDNKVYRTTTIGDQIWMAENLTFNYNWGWAKSHCVDYYGKCEDKGRYYSLGTAMDSIGLFSDDAKGCSMHACEKSERVRGVCPKGWHLPDTTEWNKLIKNAGGGWYAGNALKSVNSCWRAETVGTDSLGFSAIASGYMSIYGVAYKTCELAKFFTSDVAVDSVYSVLLDARYGISFSVDTYYLREMSVRCVKDDD